jgi:hypothetical protein
MLTDAPALDPKQILEASFAWGDLCRIEVVPVMGFEEIMKLVPKV